MKCHKLFTILLSSLLLFPVFVEGQEQAVRDGSISIVSSRLHRLGERLIVSLTVDMGVDLSTNESVELIPQLSDSLDNYLRLPSIRISGRRQHLFYLRNRSRQQPGEEDEVLRRRNGQLQTVRYLRALPFEEWMKKANLSLTERACGCGIPYSVDSMHVSSMEIPQLRLQPAFVVPHVEEVKLRKESGCAFLDFPLNEVAIYDDYRANMAELDKIRRSIDLIRNDTNVVISHIEIHGYASPEGPYQNNERLARERTQALKEYVCNQWDCQDSLIHTRHTAEDWGGLVRNLLADTLLSHRESLLHIATSDKKPDEREAKMRRNYPNQFAFMQREWFPALRHSDYTIHYIVRPFTLEQAREVFEVRPQNLSINEMFRLARTCPEGSPEYNRIILTAVKFNPDHPVTNLNAAFVELMQGHPEEATVYLEKAPASPEKTLATGLLHLLQGAYDEAERCLREAETSGLSQASYNLQLLQGFY